LSVVSVNAGSVLIRRMDEANFMTHVYLLYHLSGLPAGEQQVLFIGAYGSRPSALRAIDRLKRLRGFKKNPRLRDHKSDHGAGFNINRVRLNDDNWQRGFAS
jgi:hypothetical protein